MPYCSQCGSQNSDNARFCSQCGTPLAPPAGEPAPNDATATITFGAPREVRRRRAGLAERGRRRRGRRPARRAARCWSCSGARAPAAATCSTPTSPRWAVTPRATSSSTTSPSPVATSSSAREDGTFRVHDVGSLNGTYLNGDRVDDAELQNGDEVRIGKFRLIFFASDAKDG